MPLILMETIIKNAKVFKVWAFINVVFVKLLVIFIYHEVLRLRGAGIQSLIILIICGVSLPFIFQVFFTLINCAAILTAISSGVSLLINKPKGA